MRRRGLGWLLAAGFAIPAAGPGCAGDAPRPGDSGARAQDAAPDRRYSEAREPCADHSPLRSAFFGDLHVHTAWSMDAYVYGTSAGPDEAYRFARGESIALPAGGSARLERPLDFMAVTDHGEFLGELSLCTTPGSAAYATRSCSIFRGDVPVPGGSAGRMGALAEARQVVREAASLESPDPQRSSDLCGPGAGRCTTAARSVWQELKQSAQRHYDRSGECRFTSFAAYEYSYTPNYSKVHRNVIFRNLNTLDLPVTWIEEPSPEGLWRALQRDCLEAGTGCDVLAIPHNPNLSNGVMFQLAYRQGDVPLPEQVERASLRSRLEPLVEITQVKGDSECRNGMYRVAGGPDELCDFEKKRLGGAPDCEEGTGRGGLLGRGCISRLDFVRYALIEGLREEARIGVNPLKLGLMAGTDTHDATGGATEEYAFRGAHGADEATPAGRLEDPSNSPGGLIGVWAEENSRDSLFDAMKRRETFGTSGTRIQPRFFGGWSYAADLCERPAWLEAAYAGGVAMGGDLPRRPAGAGAPVFVIAALRDPGAPGHLGGRLQRIQIVKGWVGDDGSFQQRVHDVAGSAGEGADFDAARCEPGSGGRDALCAVWSDPAFDPGQRAVYYARILETPSCRWSALQCDALPAAQRPAACSDPQIPRAIQERAWTSPIWYAPG